MFNSGALQPRQAETRSNHATSFAQQPERLGPGITPPWTLSRVSPQYSDTARAIGIEGTVIIEAVVHKDGRLDVLGVKQGLGYGLDENALLAVRHLRLLPATKNNEPVDVAMDMSSTPPNRISPGARI